jgi:photosystem II stability/assembly factor-like uncharacterized protein
MKTKKIKLLYNFIILSILVSLGCLIPGCNKDDPSPVTPNYTDRDAVIVHSSDGGLSWTPKLIVGTGSIEVDNLYSITSLSANTLMAVGDNGTHKGVFVISTNSGVSWQVNSAGDVNALYFVFSPSTDNALVIEQRFNAYRILFTSNNGTNWSGSVFPTTNFGEINSLSFNNSTNGTAVGISGERLITNDGGHTWTEILDPAMNGTTYDITLDGNIGFAVGNSILKTTDAGASWSNVLNAPFQYTFLGVAIDYYGLGAVAVGNYGNIWRSTNSGTNWDSVSSGTRKSLNGVSANIYNYEDPVIVVGAEGTIMRSVDQGATWAFMESHTTRNLHGIYRHGDDIWVAGE